MKPSLLFISHVIPSDPRSGQQQRVLYSLKGANDFFETSFLSFGKNPVKIKEDLSSYCNSIYILPSVTQASYFAKVFYHFSAHFFSARNGLKPSNYFIDQVEFSHERIRTFLEGKKFDAVIFEYWHAYKRTELFRQKATYCVLDTHDIQWESYKRQLSCSRIPQKIKELKLQKYRNAEEKAWNSFDRVIAINSLERDYIKTTVLGQVKVDFLPMGIYVEQWPYFGPNIGQPQKIGFYGGLSSGANVESALICIDEIMPKIWEIYRNAELWLIGNQPAAILLERAKKDLRIKCTGYVKNVVSTLSQMNLILCPWYGKYGFRSRLIEVMSVGIPIVASEDAVAGMDLSPNTVVLAKTGKEIAEYALNLLDNPDRAMAISKAARHEVEERFSFVSTYYDYFSSLSEFIRLNK